MHVLIAAYLRAVSQRPGLNRFVSGQKIYTRKDIQIVMVVKKTLSIDSPDTVIKVRFNPDDTVEEVYDKFNAEVEKVHNAPDKKTSFDKLNKVLAFIPGLLCRWTVKLLNFLDYFGLLPKKLLWLSPFHGSFIITSMGSLAIPPIYHHIYNFGNLPIFLSFGAKRKETYVDDDGSVKIRPMIDFTFVTDERICDGFNYASALRTMRRYFKNPSALLTPPETVAEDIE